MHREAAVGESLAHSQATRCLSSPPRGPLEDGSWKCSKSRQERASAIPSGMVARKGGDPPAKGLGTPKMGCSKGSGPLRHLFVWNKCYEPLIPGLCQDQLSVKAVVEEPGLVKQCKCMRGKGVCLVIARHDLLCVHRMAPWSTRSETRHTLMAGSDVVTKNRFMKKPRERASTKKPEPSSFIEHDRFGGERDPLRQKRPAHFLSCDSSLKLHGLCCRLQSTVTGQSSRNFVCIDENANA